MTAQRVHTVGFIGAGAMGGPVARRLATGGFNVRVFDLSPAAVEACASCGAKAASSAEDAAAGADAVLTSLPLPEHVRSVWTGIAASLAPGTVAVDLSSIDPGTARDLTVLLSGRGIDFVSCALGKTPMAAAEGQIPLFIGGPPAAITRIGPLLARMGNAVHDFGSPEAAVTFKLVSNLIGMTNLAVLAEGYLLARRAGIEPRAFAAALDDTGARSFQSDVRLPWLMAGDYAARFANRLAAKDVRLAVEAAARWELPTPVAAQALSQLLAACAHGYADEDVVALAKVIDPAVRGGEGAAPGPPREPPADN
jgi:3-hydroxyisobutyrate dehydrogenase